MQLAELRPGDLLSTAYHEPALVTQVDRDRDLVRLHLTATDGGRSWSTAWMREAATVQGTVHRLG